MMAHIWRRTWAPCDLAHASRHGNASAAAERTPSWKRNLSIGSMSFITGSTHSKNASVIVMVKTWQTYLS